jgi:Phosphotransferase enzyme family
VVETEWRTVGEEHGLASRTGRVALRLDGANRDAPDSLVAKLPDSGDREVRFYHELRSAPAPVVHYANAGSGRAVLLLEDLTEARQGDVLVGCSPEDARRVLRAIAPFHARHWRSPDATWLLRGRDPAARQAAFDARVSRFLELHGPAVPADVRALVERLRSGLADVITSLGGGARTIVHWDLQLDNVLFDAAPGRPVVVLDWETVRVGSPAWDVAVFLFGSLAVDDRRAAEPELLAEYVALLREHGVRDYDRAQLFEDCRLAVIVLLAALVSWLAQPAPERDRERALRDAVFSDGRLVAALRDHHAAALLEP